VTAPEEPRSLAVGAQTAPRLCPPILHMSCGIRQNAGRTESFFIRLPLESLRKEEIEIPAAPHADTPEAIIARIRDAAAQQDRVQSGIKEISAMWIRQQRTLDEEASKKFENLFTSISVVPADRRDSINYVGQGESVEAATQKAITTGLTTIISRA